MIEWVGFPFDDDVILKLQKARDALIEKFYRELYEELEKSITAKIMPIEDDA